MDISLVFQQSDIVLLSTFCILIFMSILTWSIIIWRSWRLTRAKRLYAKQVKAFWQAENLQQSQFLLNPQSSPLAQITAAGLQAHSALNAKGPMSQKQPINEILLRHIRHAMKQALRPFNSGLTALASIGATAPFVGLFGTVWGIYHALINIGEAGQMTIAAVAGPIGEALVATAAGLFVAIPAVLAYNALVRSNKNFFDDVESFTHDLYVLIINQGDR